MARDETASTNNDANSLENYYADVFMGLCRIKVGAKIHVDSLIPPVIDPPRRIPHTISDDVSKELDRMLEMGVIVPQAEPTPWVNAITIVRKPVKTRICLDPTKLNMAIL